MALTFKLEIRIINKDMSTSATRAGRKTHDKGARSSGETEQQILVVQRSTDMVVALQVSGGVRPSSSLVQQRKINELSRGERERAGEIEL